MPIQITIPRLGWSMEEGTFAGWQKRDGELVRPGEILFELEGEKALQEIEAVDEGILRIPPDGPAVGAVLKVGAVIGVLVADGEQAPWESAVQPASPSPAATRVEEKSGEPFPMAAPSVRRLARELGVVLSQVSGTGRDGRITEDDVRRATTAGQSQTAAPAPARDANSSPECTGPIATPRARRTARHLGVDWTVLHGTGRNGRIRERDVVQAANAIGSSASTGVVTGKPLTGRRAVIARRMQESRQQTVPVTLTTRASAGNLVSLRNQFRTAGISPVPAYHDLIAKLVAECLVTHPVLGTRREGDRLVLPEPDSIALGLAVDTPEGLTVPVLRSVRGSSLTELTRESLRCIEKARQGRLNAQDLAGAAFTISSLGSQGIDAFTPVINYPETAILGVGAIRKVAVVTDDDRVVVGQELVLSLTFDHQVVDGAPAARFLQDLVKAIENPAARLLMPMA
jgi:pyruvate dehydrogenase E2 component (dihydrolipoamide acetyltransferase)